MSKIPEESIRSIKQSIDLVSLCQSRDIELKRTGKDYFGKCPFHEDDQASFTVNPRENLWHCFGCNTGGDVIRFVELLDKCSFREAVGRLSKIALRLPSGQAVKEAIKEKKPLFSSRDRCPQNAISPLDRSRLLSMVTDFYHAAFNQRKDGKEYLSKRGISDASLLSRFKIGFCFGSIRESIPKDGEMQADLKTLGVINGNGQELLRNCVVFPIPDVSGRIVNLYGRRTRDGQVNHLYLPGPKQGIFNGASISAAPVIILVESILDALALIQAGHPGTVPCFGSTGIPDQILEQLKKCPDKPVYLCFDSDKAGRVASARAKLQLEGVGIMAKIKVLPENHDPCSILQTPEGPLIIRDLFKSSGGHMTSPNSSKPEKILSKNGTLIVLFSDRKYELKGIQNTGPKCKTTIKISSSKDAVFHLDTIDLYSARSRSLFARSVSELFGVQDAQIASELLSLIDPVEKFTEDSAVEDEKEKKPEMTEEEKQEALSFLTAPDIFEKILEDFESIGITGEEINKTVGYLATISRKLEKPISICFQSRSSAGKSALQDAILDFVPPEDLVRYTRITGQALFYKGKDSLKNKVLAIEEDVGARDAGYSIRTMQSADYISIGVTIRDPQSGKQRTDDNRVEGPTSVFSTTTDPEPEQETASRQVFLTIDESAEATAKILEAQRNMDTLEGVMMRDQSDCIIKRHRNAQRLLEDGLKVVNPFSKHLSYPTQTLVARRDQKKYLGLIKTIAYFRQFQRKIHIYEVNGKPPRRYVNVEIDDIRLANKLAVEVLGHSLDELSPPSRQLLGIIREFVMEKSEELGVDPKELQFSRRDIREYAAWPDHQVKRYIKQLIDLEYLCVVVGRKGKTYIYELRYGDEVAPGKKYLACLVDVEKLKKDEENREST